MLIAKQFADFVPSFSCRLLNTTFDAQPASLAQLPPMTQQRPFWVFPKLQLHYAEQTWPMPCLK